MDLDDMFVNQDLFEQLFIYNSNLNLHLDIIEFSVIYQEDKEKTIYIPEYHFLNHYHGLIKILFINQNYQILYGSKPFFRLPQ